MHAVNESARSPIPFAKTVSDVASLSNPYAAHIMDRNFSIDAEFVNSIINQSVFSWEGRDPKPALDQSGNFQVTDLDLLSFMVPLVARGAVIEIPQYRNRRKIVRKTNERKIGTTNFGATTGLTSNKDVFSFSVRLFDHSIVQTDPNTGAETVGAHRNYMLVDCDGHWYDGWNRISWNPSLKENAFLSDKNLWSGNSVYFKHYVHPNRRQSIYGAPYLLLKMLSTRLSDEAGFYRNEMKRLEGLGFTLPKGEKAQYMPPISEGSTESIKVETMEMILDLPNFNGEYESVETSVDGLVKAYRRQKHLTYTLKPLVQFVIRADEAAYFRFGVDEQFVAHWMAGSKWESGFRLPRSRVEWNRLVLSHEMALRFRIKEISQKVSAE